MDGSRFDDLTRLLGATKSRRNVLKIAAGSLLAAVAGASRSGHVSAAICPNRIPNPNHTPSSNGCGTASFPVTGVIGNVDVTPACNNHDLCYDTCNNDKAGCDAAFQSEMRAICAAGNPKGSRALTDCLNSANLYYRAVGLLGGSAFDDAQTAACICCNQNEVACGSVCCASGQCHNGVCEPCPNGKELCGGRCRPACPAGFIRDASCRCVCPPGKAHCANSCADLASDPNNCGKCGRQCPACNNGQCCHDQGVSCASGADCCGGHCDPQTSICCSTLGATCSSNSSCCPQAGAICGTAGKCCLSANSLCSADTDCCGGHCDPTSGKCCSAPGQDCSIQHDCCSLSNTICNANGVCCLDAGQSCNHNQDCCNGNCDTTTKTCCLGNTATCGEPADCCGGSCAGGHCCTSHLKTCGTDGDCCTADGDICPAGVCCRNAGGACTSIGDCCFSGACQNNVCCLADGFDCAHNGDCCSGTCGHGGKCLAACVSPLMRCPNDVCAHCCSDANCSSGQTCQNGTCAAAQCVMDPGNSSCHGQRNCRCEFDVNNNSICVDLYSQSSCVSHGPVACTECTRCTSNADCGSGMSCMPSLIACNGGSDRPSVCLNQC